MTALLVWEGIEERLLTIAGVDSVQLGEPQIVNGKPAIYVLYHSFDQLLRSSPPARNLSAKEHTFGVYLVVSWVDQAAAEAQMISLLDAVTDAIDADPHLGGRLGNGSAWVDRGVSGFKSLTSMVRIFQFIVTAVEKRNTGG